MENLTESILISDIHSSGKKIAIAVTGGGAEVIGNLLRHGGGSKTIVEAIVPYGQASFDDFVRGKPDKYCSTGAARDLAMAAFNRLSDLNVGNREDFIGVGATCSLAKKEERIGREHHAYIAIQTEKYTRTYTIDLSKEDRNREEEETYVADSILLILAHECGSFLTNDVWTKEETAGDTNFLEVITGKSPFVNITGKNKNLENRIVFPGSFNPIHEQHKNIAQYVAKTWKQNVDLEICVHNVDKPTLNYTSLNERKNSILQHADDWMGDVFFTSLPTFLKKSNYFKNAWFIVGWDTFVRIIDPKYADLDKVFEAFENNNSHFMVFHRILNGVDSSTLSTKNFPIEIMKRTEIIGTEYFPAIDMSSSQLRNK